MSTPQKLAAYLADSEARRGTDERTEKIDQALLADVYEMRKTASPSKSGYGAVKSKVAGNMRSIKKSQTRTMMQKAMAQEGQ